MEGHRDLLKSFVTSAQRSLRILSWSAFILFNELFISVKSMLLTKRLSRINGIAEFHKARMCSPQGINHMLLDDGRVPLGAFHTSIFV